MSNCHICSKIMDTGNPLDRDCGGNCVNCMAESGDPDCMETRGFVKGFKAACQLLRADATKDRYGIGSMFSQWTAAEVADDLESRIGETNA